MSEISAGRTYAQDRIAPYEWERLRMIERNADACIEAARREAVHYRRMANDLAERVFALERAVRELQANLTGAPRP